MRVYTSVLGSLKLSDESGLSCLLQDENERLHWYLKPNTGRWKPQNYQGLHPLQRADGELAMHSQSISLQALSLLWGDGGDGQVRVCTCMGHPPLLSLLFILLGFDHMIVASKKPSASPRPGLIQSLVQGSVMFRVWTSSAANRDHWR